MAAIPARFEARRRAESPSRLPRGARVWSVRPSRQRQRPEPRRARGILRGRRPYCPERERAISALPPSAQSGRRLTPRRRGPQHGREPGEDVRSASDGGEHAARSRLQESVEARRAAQQLGGAEGRADEERRGDATPDEVRATEPVGEVAAGAEHRQAGDRPEQPAERRGPVNRRSGVSSAGDLRGCRWPRGCSTEAGRSGRRPGRVPISRRGTDARRSAPARA